MPHLADTRNTDITGIDFSVLESSWHQSLHPQVPNAAFSFSHPQKEVRMCEERIVGEEIKTEDMGFSQECDAFCSVAWLSGLS